MFLSHLDGEGGRIDRDVVLWGSWQRVSRPALQVRCDGGFIKPRGGVETVVHTCRRLQPLRSTAIVIISWTRAVVRCCCVVAVAIASAQHHGMVVTESFAASCNNSDRRPNARSRRVVCSAFQGCKAGQGRPSTFLSALRPSPRVDGPGASFASSPTRT